MVAVDQVVDLGPRQPAYRGSTLSVPSAAARRLLARLDKPQMIELVLYWMRGTSPDRHPPSLSGASRAPGASGQDDASSFAALADAISRERRVGSYAAALALWNGPMRDDRVPKVRALDRILAVDWPDGLSFSMIADIDAAHLASRPESRQWAAAKLVFDQEKASSHQPDPSKLQINLARELQLYFGHYTYLFPPEAAAEQAFATPRNTGDGPAWFGAFTVIRVCAAPLPHNVCGRGGGGALWLLYIPHTPWVLYSGGMGRQDSPSEARKLVLHAFAQAVGAQRVFLPSQAASSDPPASELKGRDALGLRKAILQAQAPSGGHGAGLLEATAEDAPLTEPSLRRRETVPVRAYGLPTASTDDGREHAAREREAADLFGTEDARLPCVRRIEYELRLPFPAGLLGDEYRAPPEDLLVTNPIQLRLDGAHVAAGLRKIVLAGLDVDEPGSYFGLDDDNDPPPTARQGLPLWLTEVRGTNIVIGLKQ